MSNIYNGYILSYTLYIMYKCANICTQIKIFPNLATQAKMLSLLVKIPKKPTTTLSQNLTPAHPGILHNSVSITLLGH